MSPEEPSGFQLNVPICTNYEAISKCEDLRASFLIPPVISITEEPKKSCWGAKEVKRYEHKGGGNERQQWKKKKKNRRNRGMRTDNKGVKERDCSLWPPPESLTQFPWRRWQLLTFLWPLLSNPGRTGGRKLQRETWVWGEGGQKFGRWMSCSHNKLHRWHFIQLRSIKVRILFQ